MQWLMDFPCTAAAATVKTRDAPYTLVPMHKTRHALFSIDLLNVLLHYCFYNFSIYRMTMTSFVVALYGHCCRRHIAGQRVV